MYFLDINIIFITINSSEKNNNKENPKQNTHTTSTTGKKWRQSYRYRTCNHVIHWAHFQQHLLDKAHFSARLQISNTFSKDRGKHAPDFSLAGDVTVLQQLHQAADAFRILDNEVGLQIKLTTHQLQNKVRQKENVWRDWIFMPFTVVYSMLM